MAALMYGTYLPALECVSATRQQLFLAHLLAFAGDVDLKVLDAKDLLKIFEECDKVLGNFLFAACGRRPNGKAGPNGLFHPTAVSARDYYVTSGSNVSTKAYWSG